MSKSIVKFLKEKVKPNYHTTPAGVAFYTSVTSKDLQKKLEEEKYEYAIKSAITDRDDQRQNALHVVLSNKLFLTKKADIFVLSEEDAKQYRSLSTLHAESLEKNLLAAIKRNQLAHAHKAEEEKQKSNMSFSYPYLDGCHYSNWHIKYKNKPNSHYFKSYDDCNCDSCSHSKSEFKKTEAFIKSSQVEIDRYTMMHQTAVAQQAAGRKVLEAKYLQGKQFRETEIVLCLETLLSPFDNDEDRLMDLLLAKDKFHHSPLHYAFKHLNDENLLKPLLQRIHKIKDPKNKELLALAIDDEGRNIFRALLKSGSSLDVKNRIIEFSEPVAKLALINGDKVGNTGLHEVLLPSSVDKLKKLEVLAPLVRVEVLNVDVKDVKASITKPQGSADLFVQNKDKKNPLHLALEVQILDEKQVRNAKEELDIIKHVTAACPKSIYFDKLKEKDIFGNTPLHYAVKYGPVEKLRWMLAGLTPENKTKLAQISNNNGERLMHFACQYGDRLMLEEVSLAMGMQALFELRRVVADDFQKQLAQNKAKMSVDDYRDVMKKTDLLFDIYRYLTKKHGYGIYLTESYKLRAADFHQCLLAITKGERLPVPDPKLLAGTTQEYHNNRELLRRVTKEQAQAFLQFLEKNTQGLKPCPVACQILGIKPKKPSMTAVSETLFAGKDNENVGDAIIMIEVNPANTYQEVEGEAPSASAPAASFPNK